MANEISTNAKRSLSDMETLTDTNQDVCIMMNFVIKWHVGELIMMAEFLLMNADI